jgi:DNA-binding GntR family transcriptional regulator
VPGWRPASGPRGERLPSVAALARELEAGHGTIRKALGRLQDEGWLTTLPRYGIFRSRQGPASKD